jgi:drug/metabolite transporter (DMT)-like permease
MDASRRRLDLRAAGAALVTVGFWASAFAGIRVGVASYDPGHLVLLRFLVASVAFVPYALATRMALPKRRDLPALLAMGLCGITAYHLLLTYGERTVMAGPACMLVSASPVITALLAVVFLKERLAARAWAGIAVSFAGVTLVSFAQSGEFALERGALLILLAAVSTSVYFIIQRRYSRDYGPLALAAYTMWGGTLFLLPAGARGFIGEVAAAPWSATAAVVYLGVFPGAVAYVTWAYVLSRVPASRAGSYLYLSPVLAVLVAWAWLDELPGWTALAGGVVVVAGVALVNAPRRGRGVADGAR